LSGAFVELATNGEPKTMVSSVQRQKN